jgi:hypothetical protein
MKKKTGKSEKESELSSECDFRGVAREELEACCCYEYLRESDTLRRSFAPQMVQNVSFKRIAAAANGMVDFRLEKSERQQTVILPDSGLAVPKSASQTARSCLTFALIKARWPEAGKKNKAPPSWNVLKPETKKEMARCMRRCMHRKLKQPKWHRVLLVQELLPGDAPVELEAQLEKWKEDAYYTAFDREYLFGLFRLDETYNETKAVRAFRALFRRVLGTTKSGGGPHWTARLNDLIVMRLWQRFPRDPVKRVENIVKFTIPGSKQVGFKGCNEWWRSRCRAKKAKLGFVDDRMSKAANEEMCRARADALRFFQTLFPDEIPLSYAGGKLERTKKRMQTS